MRDLKKELLDPSQIHRPDVPDFAEKKEFRNYGEDNELFDRVKKTYLDMHTNQTVAYVKEQHKKWLNFDTCQMTIMDAIEKLNELVDESDPDCDVPNAYHAYQTAEGIRRVHPDKDWFHFVGFIHDLGKLMNFYGQPQWSTVGDTFVVGCKPAKSIVYSEDTFDSNPDIKNPEYNTEFGIYQKNCGLENVIMSWGHDEYLYQVLKHNGTTIPEEGLYMIRFHSFYPWHTGQDYKHLTNEKDESMMTWVLEFNKFDLYTKDDNKLPDIEELKTYYKSLCDKYMPGILKW